MATNKHSIERYRIIDECIRNPHKPFPSKKELREACEEKLFGTNRHHICDSTIEKDIKYMRLEHDAPIKYSRLKNGYYYSDENYALADMPLTDSEIDAIKLATNILSQFKNNPLFEQFEVAIDKIVNRITISHDVRDTAIDKYVQFETVPKIEGNEHLEKILDAIKNNRVIQFSYQSFQKEKKEKIRRIKPYLLKEYRNRWYLIGKSEIEDKVKTFGLDRVKDLMVLSLTFQKDKDFDANRFFKYAIGITTSDLPPQEIKFETNEVLSKYLISQPIHSSQQYLGENEDGKHLFTLFVFVTQELKMLLLSFGADVKILAPQQLIEDTITINKAVLKLYEKTEAKFN